MSNEFLRVFVIALIACFNTRIHLFSERTSYLGGVKTWIEEYIFSMVVTGVISYLLLAWWPSFHFPILSWTTFFHFYLPFTSFLGLFWNVNSFNLTDTEEDENNTLLDNGLSLFFSIIYLIILFIYAIVWIAKFFIWLF